jgi:hypothetical protein
MSAGAGIGTLREGPLHAAIKRWYAVAGDRVEVPVDGYVVDLVRGDLLVEIQTGSFSAIQRKMRTLVPSHPVRLVHPIPRETWLVKLDPEGGRPTRRRSPRRGTVHDLFGELVSFPELLDHPNLEIEVLLVALEEVRRYDGRRGRRRRGWVVHERHLLDVQQSVVIRRPGDLASLLPVGLAEPFTTSDLAAAIGRPRRLAQQMAYCLRRTGVIASIGKSGNALHYGRAVADGARPDEGG